MVDIRYERKGESALNQKVAELRDRGLTVEVKRENGVVAFIDVKGLQSADIADLDILLPSSEYTKR